MGIYKVRFTEYICNIKHAKTQHMKKLLMNLQGFTFTVEKAKEFYGERFETAILAKVIVD